MHRDIRMILDVVEASREPISDSHMAVNFGKMTDVDTHELVSAMWNMFNQVLTGEAHSVLTNTRDGGGLEVWCFITA